MNSAGALLENRKKKQTYDPQTPKDNPERNPRLEVNDQRHLPERFLFTPESRAESQPTFIKIPIENLQNIPGALRAPDLFAFCLYFVSTFNEKL